MALWDSDFILFSRLNYLRGQKANIESLFTLYMNDPQIIGQYEDGKTVTLYDSIPGSTMHIQRELWGLYEKITVSSDNNRLSQIKLLGVSRPYHKDCTLWYNDNKSSLTITGYTNLHGLLLLPQNGIVYGQMQSVFFAGEPIERTKMGHSDNKMPEIMPHIRKHIDNMLTGSMASSYYDSPDSLTIGFKRETHVIRTDDGEITGHILRGNIIIMGDKINIDSSTKLNDVLIIGNEINIGADFRGSLQAFARDSITIGRSAILEYPSGLYSGKYIEIRDNAAVNGYVICDYTGETDIKKPNGKMARTSKIRGLLWNSGIMQFQGIVNGSVFLNKAVYYAPHGYYQNMFYDVTIFENDILAYPLWIVNESLRREVKWLN